LIGAGIGAVAGVGLYTLNVLRTNNGNLDSWDLGQAALVGGTGAIAGALIGTGVGAPAAITAITQTATLASGASAMVATTITSTGVGIAAGGSGYLASNIVFDKEFNGADFTTASVVGGVTGALGPSVATTNAGATVLGASSNMAQYSITQTIHNQSIDPTNLLFSGFTGAIGGRIGGGYYNPRNGIYAKDYFDIHVKDLSSELTNKFFGGGVRSFAGSTVSNMPVPK
jgi:hypothetical protein